MFENKDRCDFVLTDVLFAFEELYNTISDSKINSIIEIGSGTGILLNELSDAFPKKILVLILMKVVFIIMKILKTS